MTSQKTGDLNNLDSVSKRLKYLIDTLGVKQSHMAAKLGLSPSGLHYILNNDVKFSKSTQKIADYLKVNKQWISSGEGEIYNENISIKTYKIPVYYLDQLKLYYRSSTTDKMKTNDFILSTTAYRHKTIGIYMTETSFAPKFEVSDIIIFEQTQDFQDGEIVLFYLSKTNDIVLNYAFHKENNSVLLFSPGKELLQLSQKNQDIMIGSYRECHKKSDMF